MKDKVIWKFLLAIILLACPLSAQWYLAQPQCVAGERAAFINLDTKAIPYILITSTKTGAFLGLLENVPPVRLAGPKGVVFFPCVPGGITWTVMTVFGEKPIKFYTKSTP